jgi:hypothetical protein
MSIKHTADLQDPRHKIQETRPDMEGGLSRGQGEAAPATVAVDAASG